MFLESTITLEELLETVQAVGVQLGVIDGELRYKGARGALTDDLRAQIRERRSQIIAYLSTPPDSAGAGGASAAFQPVQDADGGVIGDGPDARRPRTAAELVATLPQAPCHGGCGASAPYGWECESCRTGGGETATPRRTEHELSVMGYARKDELLNEHRKDELLNERNTQPTTDGQISMDLVTTQTASTAPFPQVEAEGMWFPRAKLLQGLSPEVNNGDGRPGQWHIEGHGAVPSIVMVPLGERMSRRLTEGEGDDMLTLCFSDDGLEGRGDPGGPCPSCLMAEWQTDEETGKRRPPACVLTRSWFGYAPAIQLPVRIDLKRTAEKGAQQIRTFVRLNGAGYVGVELGSEQRVASGGFKYHIPTVKKVTVPDEELATARQLLSTPAAPTEQLADEDVPF